MPFVVFVEARHSLPLPGIPTGSGRPASRREESNVEVILREDVENLGKIGDVVEVAGGFGRNYLLPNGLAVKASTKNLKEQEHQKSLVQARMDRQRREAEVLAGSLDSVSCTISRKTGEEEKLYGSVTSRDIEEALKQEGVSIDRRRILLEEPIKKLGVYTVPVKLHTDVTGNIKVWVVKQ
jgi:large subunit ribosomal protein L9